MKNTSETVYTISKLNKVKQRPYLESRCGQTRYCTITKMKLISIKLILNDINKWIFFAKAKSIIKKGKLKI